MCKLGFYKLVDHASTNSKSSSRPVAMSGSLPRSILHVDMDAFYASVEQRDRPELRGRPVIVGGLRGRGVVCAASYEARPFGVHSAMPTATAKRLCPHAVFLPVRMKLYAEIGRQIRDILLTFTPLVEPLSLDEAFLDVAGCEPLFGTAPEIAVQIKARVKSETGLTASVGVAPNKFLAKLASDHGKPNGLVVVAFDRVAEFLAPLPVGRIWGVGKKAEKRLHALGIETIGQLARLSEQDLVGQFGDLGEHFRQLANGNDNRQVVPDREAKSISTETTFAKDISDRQLLRDWLLDLTDQLAARLRHVGLRARTVELKIRSSDFKTRHRAQALPEASNATDAIWQTAQTIFEQGLTREMLPLRLLGVGATRLTAEAAAQHSLFDAEERDRQHALDQTVDAIRKQFGSAAVRRGALVDRVQKDKPA
ncbi:MAG TPA: DNA polymerase IV [Planctomycetaceae bacterium]|nr:DNA polymerase IV [Planctomycetaceae bacterium]